MTASIVLTKAAMALLATCASVVGTQSMSGLVTIESNWHQFAIADVDGKAAYCVPWGKVYPCTYTQAVNIATQLTHEGHSISAGYAQINTVNWEKYGLNSRNVFNPCVNLSDGADILYKDYTVAALRFPSGDPALRQAFSMYNSGRFYAAMGYANDVYNAAVRTQLQYASAVQIHPARSTLERRRPAPFNAARLFESPGRSDQPLYRTFLPLKATHKTASMRNRP